MLRRYQKGENRAWRRWLPIVAGVFVMLLVSGMGMVFPAAAEGRGSFPVAAGTGTGTGWPPTATQTLTPTMTPTPSPAFTFTPTLTFTPTSTATPAATPVPPRAVLISEVAWAGTAASAYDEWLELYNPGDTAIDLTGWRLTASDGSPDIALQGTIAAHGFFLLERTDDDTVSDIPADQIYTGNLSNGGEALTLYGPLGEVVDTANGDGGAWPAGDAASHATMERIGLSADSDAAWGTNTGWVTHGHDADGNPLRGTARYPNSVNFPTPTPTATGSPTPTATPTNTPTPTPTPTVTPTAKPLAGRVLIGEFLPHPRYDWNGDGYANSGDEFIEIVNLGPGAVNLDNWILDDGEGGSRPYEIPETGLLPGHVVVFFAHQTGIILNDRGDTVRLFRPNGQLVDEVRYVNARSWNLSWCRPNWGWGSITYPCWPTPGAAKNVLYDVATKSVVPYHPSHQNDAVSPGGAPLPSPVPIPPFSLPCRLWVLRVGIWPR